MKIKLSHMRLISSVTFLLLVSCSAFAQILEPTHWVIESSKKEVKIGDEVDIILKATIDEGWHVYSVGFDPDCGPILMNVVLENNSTYKTIGTLRAINDKGKHDKTFDCDVRIFEKKAEFRQKIKIIKPDLVVKGAYDGQVCSDKEGKCIPFDGEINLSIHVASSSQSKDEAPNVETKLQEPTTVASSVTDVTDSAKQNVFVAEKKYTSHTGPVLDPTLLDGEASYGQESFGALLFLAFLAGFAALLTPCVFPMVPMTVTFFLRDNQSKWQGIKKALVFGISIIAIYTSAGTLFAILLGPEGLNALATHWIPNLFVFVIFIVFALSFFGLFEITAPHKLVNKVDQQAEKGGLLGVFFMATTLVLVSFSCTVPIVGSVLTFSAGGEIIKPISMMFFYSLAFALPFTFFAFFPELIKSLPKSGGWLNTVKVTLGFIELGLSLKFLSIADQAYHWGLLDRDINIALWIVIFGLLGVYLLGKIRLQGDSPVEKLGVFRLLFAGAVLSFVVYLIPGLWGAPLKALAGYLPPLYTHDFDLLSQKEKGKIDEQCEVPKYADFLHLPHGLSGYFDYDQALECARALNKPLFIDFTGHGCTNCREMEAVVWSDPQVLKRLQENFVVVALYVDDKTELAEEEWVTSKYDQKLKKTIGKKNADIQIANLNNNAQPFYVIVGIDETVMAWPYAYNHDVKSFIDFLDKASLRYNSLFK